MASIGTGSDGHGGKKSVDSEIPLVPFIDLLLCCIMFLLVTAVWNQLASVEAQLNGPGRPESEMVAIDPQDLPLTVHITPNGFRIGSALGDQTEIPLAADDAYDLAGLQEHLQARHRLDPNDTDVVLSADDGVAYHDIVATMDVFVANDFPSVTISGEGL